MKKVLLSMMLLTSFAVHAQSQPTMTIQSPILVPSNQPAVVDDKGGLRKCQATNMTLTASEKAKCDRALTKKPEDNSSVANTATNVVNGATVDQRRGRGTDDVTSNAINGSNQRRGRGQDDAAASAFK